MHTPILTANDCEGAGEMFQVTTLIDREDRVDSIPEEKEGEKGTGKIDYSKDFFGKRSSLTVSG